MTNPATNIPRIVEEPDIGVYINGINIQIPADVENKQH